MHSNSNNFIGYAGLKSNVNTLNAEFFSNIKGINLCNYEGRFPQRVPRLGFFEELEIFDNATHKGLFELKNLIKSKLNTNERISLVQRNCIHSLLRLGDFETIQSLDINNMSYDNDFLKLEILLVKITNNLTINLSNQEDFAEKDFLKFSSQTLRANIPILKKIEYLNRVVVTLCRYSKYDAYKNEVHQLVEYIIKNLTQFNTKDKYDLFVLSIIYRGVAMAYKSPIVDTPKFLGLSLQYALEANDDNEDSFFNILTRENLYTLYLTLYKYHLNESNDKDAFFYYEKMNELDPNDSTHHTEAGMYFVNKDLPKQAKPFFLKAIKSGPPAMAMNHYFLGLCYQNSSQYNKFIYNMKRSMEYDPLAITPVWELLIYYKASKDTYNYHYYKEFILNNKNLMEQLEDEELTMLIKG